MLRLFRREKGRFSDDTVHEKVEVSGQVRRLSASIEHDSIADLNEAHEKIGRYAAAAAAQLIEKGARASVAKALLHAVWAFVHSYLFKLGFLDGAVGMKVAAYKASYTYQKWARVASGTS